MIYTLWQGFNNNTKGDSAEKKMPDIAISWSGVSINKKHLKTFCRICGIKEDFKVPFLYPFIFAYPCMLRLVSQTCFPFPMFKILHVRSETTGYRPIDMDDSLEITCTSSDQRFLAKGVEFDLQTTIMSKGEKVWENISTFYVRTKTKLKEVATTPPRLMPMDRPETIGKWHLPAKDRFRFARISGDSNGIHYNKWYAKMFGFKRDYAQPLRVTAKCMSYLPLSFNNETIRLNLHYKGPVYYNSDLILNYQEKESGHRFDLFCEGNPKPCICGMVL